LHIDIRIRLERNRLILVEIRDNCEGVYTRCGGGGHSLLDEQTSAGIDIGRAAVGSFEGCINRKYFSTEEGCMSSSRGLKSVGCTGKGTLCDKKCEYARVYGRIIHQGQEVDWSKNEVELRKILLNRSMTLNSPPPLKNV